MQSLKKVHHLLLLCLSLRSFYFTAKSISQEDPVVSYCGETRIQQPFLPLNTTNSYFLKNLLLCKSNTLYLRTTIGLFKISSIDYKTNLLTISHSSCSIISSHFISPRDLSAGFPSPGFPNSLLLFNCSNQTSNVKSPFLHSCKNLKAFKDSYSMFCGEDVMGKENLDSSSCLVIDDVGEMGKDFHPEQMNCTHYRRVYRASLAENDEKVEVGTRISFDVLHVPNPCGECRKPYGNCGVGLKCICHIVEACAFGEWCFSKSALHNSPNALPCNPQCTTRTSSKLDDSYLYLVLTYGSHETKEDKVINGGSTPNPRGNIIIIFSLGLVVAFMNLYF